MIEAERCRALRELSAIATPSNLAAPGTGERILVIRLSAFGDLILALAPMAAIRRHHARAHITALTTKPYATLLKSSPYVDEVWVDERPSAWNVGGWLALRRRLREGHFTRVYDLQTSDRSGCYFRLLGPGPRPEWSGIVSGCSHPHRNPLRHQLHVLDAWADQLREAGVPDMGPVDLSWLAADISRFDLPPNYVLLVPGGSPHRPQKIWPAERYGELAQHLHNLGLIAAVLGTTSEQPLAAAIATHCQAMRDLTGRTDFADLAALARGAAAAVGGVTGPMHLLAAAGAPSLVMFSAISDPAQCGPRGPRVAYLRRDDLSTIAVAEVAERLLPLTKPP